MYLSRIKISKFRNFSDLDVPLSGNVVIVGENRVGKCNLLYALRLIFDPSLPDSDRLLGLADFWDGLEAGPSATDKIVISVEILDFENDEDVLAVRADVEGRVVGRAGDRVGIGFVDSLRLLEGEHEFHDGCPSGTVNGAAPCGT